MQHPHSISLTHTPSPFRPLLLVNLPVPEASKLGLDVFSPSLSLPPFLLSVLYTPIQSINKAELFYLYNMSLACMLLTISIVIRYSKPNGGLGYYNSSLTEGLLLVSTYSRFSQKSVFFFFNANEISSPCSNPQIPSYCALKNI